MAAKEWKVKQLKHDNLLEGLRLDRGVELEFEYEKQLHDPFLMQDMSKAVARILRAIEKDERMMIFADYDADGVPGAAALAIFLQKLGFCNFSVYLPDRHLEDYGLSKAAIDQAQVDNVKLLLTIDCGIANAKEIAYAKKLKIETIVTDHHLVPEKLPKAVAVLDPKRSDCNYPNKNLCGAGVVFKLVQALLKSARLNLKDAPRFNLADISIGWEKWLLDLIAIATVSDMVPLVGENRALVHFGLRVLRRSPRPGIVELCRALRLKQEKVLEDDIAFSIGPRINAASRMAHAREAFELLTTEDVAVAATIARRLEKLNKERRAAVDKIITHLKMSRFNLDIGLSPIMVVGHESWSLGVLGLTASRLVEAHRCPVFIWGKNSKGMIKGSCRSDGTINVVELMRVADNLETKFPSESFFLNIGGHHHAGGFSLHQDKLLELESRLLAAFEKMLALTDGGGDDKLEKLEIDAELELSQVTPSFYNELIKLSPFGIENPKPVFLFRNVEVIGVRKFGDGAAHLELVITDSGGKKFPAISFFNTFPDLNLQPGQTIDLAAFIELSHFGRYPELRLRIVDLRK